MNAQTCTTGLLSRWSRTMNESNNHMYPHASLWRNTDGTCEIIRQGDAASADDARILANELDAENLLKAWGYSLRGR